MGQYAKEQTFKEENIMRKFYAICLTLFAAFAIPAYSQNPAPPLRLIQSIPLPGVPGALDHMGIDVKRQRLFVPAETHHTVSVMDLKTGKRIHMISDVTWPSTVVYQSQTDEVIVTDREDGSVKFFSGDKYELVKTVKLDIGKGPDNATYDPATQIFYSVSGGRKVGIPYTLLAVIDTKTKEHRGDIKIESNNVQQMPIEPGTGPKKMYATMRDKQQIAVIDLEKRTTITTWPTTPECTAPYSASLDVAHHRLFVGCRMFPSQDQQWAGGRMIVMDTDTGKMVAKFDAGGGADEMFFDVPSQRIYQQGYEGIVDVWKEVDPDHYQALGHIQGGFHGKTSLLVPELKRYYVAVSQQLHTVEGVQGGKVTEACIEVYEVLP
jgi:DNA-binding beta-propeller fold protein YncE